MKADVRKASHQVCYANIVHAPTGVHPDSL